MSRTIVVLSDGTGNSSAKLFKTNVWRLYQAVDQTPDPPAGTPRQIAYYDDGVGSSAFRPLALLGGAVGFGLKRNVLDIYRFLCRNHVRDDRIYAFGFSRGAFTIRILVDFIAREGLLPRDRVDTHAEDAYRHYRRCFNQTGGLVDPLRDLRDKARAIWQHRMGRPSYAELAKEMIAIPEIAFVGVWDTVSAYGMPITELCRGIDRWVWPLSMGDYKLSHKVKVARHALSLDDERDTFHPLLWDELESPRPQRIRQVWFAGVHSDVGGGYPEDGLAHVSLQWMMEEAERAGLRFLRPAKAEIRRAANPFAPMHDSRKALAAYYRYQPRKISARLNRPDPTTLIMQDPDLKKQVGGYKRRRGLLRSVRIHASVFERIHSGTDGYAPIVLPRFYEVEPSAPFPEHGNFNRAMKQEWVWNDVWRRRVNYFLTVALSLVLLIWPLLDDGSRAGACAGPHCLVAAALLGAGSLLPDFVAPWLEAYAASPGLFLAAAAGLLLLTLRGAQLQGRIHQGMHELWQQALVPSGPAPTALPVPMTVAGRSSKRPKDLIYRTRTAKTYQRSLQFLKWRLVPGIFGVALLCIIAAGVAGVPLLTLYRVQLAVDERAGEGCIAAAEAQPFTTSSRCWWTGARLDEDRRYVIRLKVTDAWKDKRTAMSPAVSGGELPWYIRYPFIPTRRFLDEPWYRPMLKIVPDRGRSITVPLPMRRTDHDDPVFSAEFLAAVSGNAFLFVNDAIITWNGRTEDYYENNSGAAEVSIVPYDVPAPLQARTE